MAVCRQSRARINRAARGPNRRPVFKALLAYRRMTVYRRKPSAARRALASPPSRIIIVRVDSGHLLFPLKPITQKNVGVIVYICCSQMKYYRRESDVINGTFRRASRRIVPELASLFYGASQGGGQGRPAASLFMTREIMSRADSIVASTISAANHVLTS